MGELEVGRTGGWTLVERVGGTGREEKRYSGMGANETEEQRGRSHLTLFFQPYFLTNLFFVLQFF